MAERSAQEIILDRYREKCRLAGGPRVGYVLRKRAILYVAEDHPGVDLEAGLSDLVAAGLVTPSESDEFYFLTAAGAKKIGGEDAAA